ncbi:XylR N-terminal domain-containing protein [Advenella faeciporci]|uniref:XylR N-terminal domain-containing protein n=1 Tax=Advenella faeciporci TaxID=797535 RepID=UPI0027E58728|nr:XylR N-terminal domain-containing protein [Advenella faeciporci]
MLSQVPPFPSDEDLRKLLHFSSEDGRIWLADQRMLLIHAASLNSLRHELITAIGPTRTRRLMMRAIFFNAKSCLRKPNASLVAMPPVWLKGVCYMNGPMARIWRPIMPPTPCCCN